MAASGADGTGSLEKALDVLEAVGASPEGLSQNELTARLSMPRTTVYRLLATLVGRGLLRRDPLRKVYCLGFRCFEMARQAYAMPDLVAAAAGELRSLRDLTGETTYLAALDGLEVISLERCDGAHSLRSASDIGQRKPVHCTSQGKAILSAMEATARDALVRELVLKPMTEHTITDRRRLQAELRITAVRGWSIDDEEIAVGVRCVGAPVVDGAGKVRGAISVAGPAWRLTRERVELLGPEVAQAGRRICVQLCATPSAPGDAAVRPLAGAWAFHGAHPRWSGERGLLYWADTLAPAVHVHDGRQDAQLLATDAPICGLAFLGDGLLVVTAAGALRVAPDGRAAPLTGWPAGRLLALGAGDGEALWAAMEVRGGQCAVGPLLPGGRFDPQWQIDESVQALAWDAAQGLLYATAPRSGSVLVLRPGVASVRRLASLPRGSGQLSGLALDVQGGLWTALRDGWSVVRLSPEGDLDRVIGLPVSCPTDLCFGGADGSQMFVTTARQPVPLDTLVNAPLSGRLLVTQP